LNVEPPNNEPPAGAVEVLPNNAGAEDLGWLPNNEPPVLPPKEVEVWVVPKGLDVVLVLPLPKRVEVLEAPKPVL